MSEQNQQDCCSSTINEMFDSQFFKALADGSRLAVLMQLAAIGNEKTVTEIAACCPQSISVVSRHLKMLKESGILSAQKHGKEVVYRFENKEVANQLRRLADAVENCC
ncbi:MAG: metalloregulator ArsR/SmtB family transcription factor [Pseudomonadales bacterium]|nr:metalloregulator ArsR/SmtB family transcription factor [Pseudomonadales bacterium]